MFCEKCGKDKGNSNHCPHCGSTGQAAVQAQSVGAMGILFFLFPVVGWILYFVWHGDQPVKARSAAKWAWIGFAVGFLLWVASFAFLIFVPKFADLDGAAKAAACMQNQQAIESACAIYYANSAMEGNPKYPDSIEDLVTEGFLDEMPLCPEGMPYKYDNTIGDADCDQSSGGHSHSY